MSRDVITPTLFDLASVPATPWKNGVGSTREIVRLPRDADLDTFDWRVSVAELSADGAFSSFAGVDRLIALLDGRGVQMQSRDGAIDHQLTGPFEPFAFPGEAAIDATLVDGPSRDFNVMTRRSTTRATVSIVRAARVLEPLKSGLLFAARGAWEIVACGDVSLSHRLQTSTGVWWSNQSITWRAEPANGEKAHAVLLAVNVISAL
jgi:hypothetical protein